MSPASENWKQLKNNDAGATVSFENPAGERVTVARPGAVSPAIRECVDAVRGIDPSMLVVAVSTRQTIYSDLRGRDPNPYSGVVEMPEPTLMRTAKRFDALHPRLCGQSRQAETRRRGKR